MTSEKKHKGFPQHFRLLHASYIYSKKWVHARIRLLSKKAHLYAHPLTGIQYHGLYQGLGCGEIEDLSSVFGILEWATSCSRNRVWAGSMLTVTGHESCMTIHCKEYGPFCGRPKNSQTPTNEVPIMSYTCSLVLVTNTTYLQMIEDIKKAICNTRDDDPALLIYFSDYHQIDQCLQCPSSPIPRGELNVKHTVSLVGQPNNFL